MTTFLHIPKTAGSAIGTAIQGANSIEGTSPISIFGHEYNLRDLEGHGVTFCIRDPVDRVVSGFYSRLRMGRPRNNVPHTRDEAKTFRRWPTFVDLATEVTMGKHRAERGWHSIGHLRPLSTWLVDTETLNSSKISYIAEITTLDLEWPTMCKALGLPMKTELPKSPIDAHRAPTPAPVISAELRAALEEFLADDYVLHRECQAIRRCRGWAG